jgi:MIP family channel proteins
MGIDIQHLVRQAACEFIACLLFVFVGCGSVCAAVASGGADNPINYASAFGFTITVLAYSIGDVSGAHINPAVTLAMAVARQISPVQLIVYWVAQFTGAMCGGAILHAAVGEEMYFGGIGLHKKITPEGGFALEFMGTFILVFVVFNVALWSSGLEKTDVAGSVVSGMSPLSIGLTVLVVHLVLGPLTGCGINPARVLGSSVMEGEEFWTSDAGLSFWIYFVGPFLGAPCAVMSYYLMYPGVHTTPGDAPVTPVEKGDVEAPAPAAPAAAAPPAEEKVEDVPTETS